MDHAEFREAARHLTRIDVDVYAEAGRDPLEPIVGYGHPDCRIAIFGRDPGRHEVHHGLPFVGAGGQLVRRTLHAHLHGSEMPDFAASLAVGEHVFWANTVPYKPVGNKVWGIRDRRRFAPLMTDVLVHGWRGRHVICLGRVAFDWFGLADKGHKARLAAFWQREDRYTASIDVTLVARDGTHKAFTLHPLPHPSPLNATWYRKVPALLTARLSALDWRLETVRQPN